MNRYFFKKGRGPWNSLCKYGFIKPEPVNMARISETMNTILVPGTVAFGAAAKTLLDQARIKHAFETHKEKALTTDSAHQLKLRYHQKLSIADGNSLPTVDDFIQTYALAGSGSACTIKLHRGDFQTLYKAETTVRGAAVQQQPIKPLMSTLSDYVALHPVDDEQVNAAITKARFERIVEALAVFVEK